LLKITKKNIRESSSSMCEWRRGGGGGGVGGTKTQKLTTKELEIKQFVDVIALAENVINLDFRQ
jgi:hypothetical protein